MILCPYAIIAGDINEIILGFAEGYRASWDSCLGGFKVSKENPDKPAHFLEPNPQKWSGDHCSVDPSLVSGIFFATMKLALPADAPVPDVRHVAPTILKYFEVEPPPGLRAPLLAR